MRRFGGVLLAAIAGLALAACGANASGAGGSTLLGSVSPTLDCSIDAQGGFQSCSFHLALATPTPSQVIIPATTAPIAPPSTPVEVAVPLPPIPEAPPATPSTVTDEATVAPS